ncbi:hypothetical protein BDW67DRAFT_180731 [Aspergillus spinulosporus]
MPTLQVTIQINGDPVKRVYVEHIWRIPVTPISGPLGLYMTDDQGRVRDQDGNLGIDSFATDEADIRILGQNSVARIVEGHGALLVTPVWVDFVIRNESVVNLNDPNTEKADHFRILNLALKNYDEDHRDQGPGTIVFPDNLAQPLVFCEPMSLAIGYPLIHLKGRNQSFNDRLFGGAGQTPTLIPSEFSHALHFSLLDSNSRGQAERQYAKFLLSQIAGGAGPFHNMGTRTSTTVAYIEAMDHFSSRFSAYLRLRPEDPNPTGNFVSAELSVIPRYWLAGAHQAGKLVGDVVKPSPAGGLPTPKQTMRVQSTVRYSLTSPGKRL